MLPYPPQSECQYVLALMARDAAGQQEHPVQLEGGMGVLALWGSLAEVQKALQCLDMLQL